MAFHREKSQGMGNYDIALYATEMCLEIAIKSFLINNGVDYPKKHDIIDHFKSALDVKGGTRELKESRDDMIRDFTKLLDLRNDVGYNFGRLKKDAALKDESSKMIENTRKYIKIIEKAL